MPEKLRIGVIGLGRWGSNILRTLHAEPDVEIAWTAGSRDWQAKLEKMPHSAEHTDGVTIAVPAPFAPTIARMALDYGAPIFLEKPMALDPADARLIRNRATVMGGLPVLVDHVGLFSTDYEVLLRELTGKKIDSIETFAGNMGPVRNWGTEHDVLWDYGPHEAAFALDLLGVPDEVTATHEAGDYRVRLTYGASFACLQFSNVWATKWRILEVHAEGKRYRIDGLTTAGTPPLTCALRVWLAAVRGDRTDPRLGPDLGVKVTELLFRIQEALRVSQAK